MKTKPTKYTVWLLESGSSLKWGGSSTDHDVEVESDMLMGLLSNHAMMGGSESLQNFNPAHEFMEWEKKQGFDKQESST
jgi:hypothetical protein